MKLALRAPQIQTQISFRTAAFILLSASLTAILPFVLFSNAGAVEGDPPTSEQVVEEPQATWTSTINEVDGSTARPTVSGVVTWSDPDAAEILALEVNINGFSYSAQTTESGAWSVTIPAGASLENGTYEAIVRDESGATVASREFTIAVVATEPTTPTTPTKPPTSPGTTTPTTPGTSTGGQNTPPRQSTPTIIGPSALSQVQNDTSTTEEATEDTSNVVDTSGVQGASSQNSNTFAASADTNGSDGTVFNLEWYWWLAIVGGISLGIWGVTAAVLRRDSW